MEPIFFSCFPLTSIWKITCEKDEIWLGEETKGAPLLFGFFFARKVMGNGRKRRRGKRLRRHFAIKPRKEGGQKPASPPPPLLLSLCRTKSGGHCLAEVDVDDVDRRVVKCSSDGRREIIKCPVRKGRKPLLYLLSDSEPIPPYPTVGHFFGKLPFGAFGGNDLFLLCFSYFFLFPSMASQLYTFCSSFLAVPVPVTPVFLSPLPPFSPELCGTGVRNRSDCGAFLDYRKKMVGQQGRIPEHGREGEEEKSWRGKIWEK